MRVPINFGTDSESDRFNPVPLHINCEAVQTGKDAQNRDAVYAKHGLTTFTTLTNGGGSRGLIALQNKLYVASGQKFFSVDTSGSIEEIGGIPGNDRVYMEVNRRTDAQMMLVSNGLVYQYQSGNFSEFNDPDLPPPVSVLFLNGYFIFLIADGRMFSSNLESSEVESNDFATAEAKRDGLLGGIVRGDDLVVFGPDTIEYWRNDAGSNFPFSKVHVSPQGCMSGKSIAEYNNIIFWVDKRGVVRAAQSYEGRIVSDTKIHEFIKDEPNKESLEGFTYSDRGVGYYVLSGTNSTWVLNLDTGEWYKSESYNSNKWRGLYAHQFDGKIIIGDYQANKLYKVDSDVSTEGGDHMIVTIRTPISHEFPNKIQMNDLILNLMAGQGDGSNNSHNSNPVVEVRTSLDGGNSWGATRTQRIGQQGQRTKQVRFNGFGTSREDGFSIEIKMSAAVARGINGASADVTVIRP